MILRHHPHVMCGDFNMSLYNLVEAFRGRLQPVLLASYAWRAPLGGPPPVVVEEKSDEEAEPPPLPPLPRPAVVGTPHAPMPEREVPLPPWGLGQAPSLPPPP